MSNEFALLNALAKRPVSIYTLNAVFPISDITEAISLGLIQRRSDSMCLLTSSGKARCLSLSDALVASANQADQQAQQQAYEDSKEKRSSRRSWAQFWLGIFIGWILGGFTMHEVFNFLVDAFQRIFH